jgi:glutamate racemase
VTTSPPATVGVFDAGIGGLPIAALLRQRAPQHRLVYLGDAARRPYGPRPPDEVAQFVKQAEAFFIQTGCDVWVIACHTASVVADAAGLGALPVVDMVAAGRHAARAAPSGPVGILATAGTVASGVFPRELPAREVHQVPTEELLRLAEEGRVDDRDRLLALAADAIEQLRGRGCTSVVLACTDFTCIIDTVRAVARDLVVIDPMDSAVELTLRALTETAVPPLPAAESQDHFCLTGPHPVDMATFARDRLGLHVPEVRIVDLDPTSTNRRDIVQ